MTMHTTTPDAEIPSSRLLAELRARGLGYLRGSAMGAIQDEGGTRAPLAAPKLFRALAASHDPRVRDAIVSLLLLHPELAVDTIAAIRAARAAGADDVAERLATRALATLYLQCLWHPALTLALGHPPAVPERPFLPEQRARGLPPIGEGFGTLGLRQLAAAERRQLGVPVDVLGDWQNQVERLIQQEWARQSRSGSGDDMSGAFTLRELAQMMGAPALQRPFRAGLRAEEGGMHHNKASATGTGPEQAPGEHALGEDETMSFRPDVAREEIERFLRELGQAIHEPGRVYLTGGAALVHAGIRGLGATTVDIDLALAVPDEHAMQMAIRRLITTLGVNVELAGPGDFIPLPSGWETASHYVGHYGALEVFYLDFTTLALAKIARSTSRDLADLELLAAQGRIERSQLETAYAEIRPQLGFGRFFHLDPEQFDRKLHAVTQRLWES